MLSLYVALSVPFYSSKGRPRLQGVGIRISLDRGRVRWPTRGPRTGVASSRLVTAYFDDDGACASEFSPCSSSWIGLGMSMLVRRGSSHVWGGWSADFHRLILPWEGTCLLEGQAHERPCYMGALTSGASRDAVMRYHVCYTVLSHTFVHLGG